LRINAFKKIMWKEELPLNCPPENAAEMDLEAYRIIKDEEPEESDFLPYALLYPENIRYRNLCEAYALSSFDSSVSAIKTFKNALKRGKLIGNFVARFEIIHSDGKNIYNKRTGHISTWLYSNKTYSQFRCKEIKRINEN